MKIVLTCILAYIGLVLAGSYKVKIKNDGSTIQGGTIHFVAEVYENGVPATGPFRYEWVDNTIAQHSATHDVNWYKDEWDVPCTDKDGTEFGSYETTVTVKKLINFAYVPVAATKSSFSVTKNLHGPFLVSAEPTGTGYLVTHEIVLTTPNAKYLEDNGASISTYWYVDGVYYAMTNGLTLTMNYPILYRRIGIQALVVAQLHNKKKSKTSNTVYTYIDNGALYPIINHYDNCNASFPFIIENKIKVKKNTILGCFTRSFKLWDPFVSGNVPVLSLPFTPLDAKTGFKKQAEDIALSKITDPMVKSLVQFKFNVGNEYIPNLARSNSDENSRDAIYHRWDEIKKSQDIALQKVTDPVAKAALINRLKEENKRLSIRASQIDTRLKESVDNIHKKNSESKKSQELYNKVNSQNHDITKTTAYKVNKHIEDLKDAENKVLDRIDDPIIKSLVLDRIHEQNKRIPKLLKLSAPEADISEVVDKIHTRIDDEIKRSNDVLLDGVKDPLIKEAILNKLDEHKQQLEEKSKEIDKNLEIPLSELRKRLQDLKDAEDTATENITDPDVKEEVIGTIDKENEKIPILMFPMMMGKNLDFVMDIIRAKMGGLVGNEALLTRNESDPIIQSLIASKFDKVNSILNTKFKMLSDGFSNVLNSVASSVDESSAEEKKTPVLTKTLDPQPESLDFPSSLASNFSMALDSINARINDLKDTTGTVTQNITIPAIQALVASKFDKVNTILSTKYTELSNNFTSIIDTIKAKLANITFDTSTKSKKPKTPKLGLPLDSEDDDEAYQDELIANYTAALDTLRTKMDGLKNAQGILNVTNPFAQTIVNSKLNTINWLLNTKYQQLNDNFTNYLNTISAKTDKKVPKLSLSGDSINSDIDDLSLPASLAANFSVALDAINTRIDDLKNTTDVITQNITDPAVQALVASKLDKVNTILSTKYQQLSDNFTSIIDTINEKLTNATTGVSKKSPKKPKKVPKLGKTLDDADDSSEIITNFTIALDAIRTRIDDLKNAETVITQNITNPFAKAIVSAKMDRINFILKTKYKQLNDNFTNIMDTINAKLANVSTDSSTTDLTGARKIPKLTKSFDFATNYSTILDMIHSKITGKKKSASTAVKYIKDPAVREILINKIAEENKNLSTIADNVEKDLTAALDDLTKKAKDLNTLEDLTVDYIDDPNLQKAVMDQIQEENEEIPMMSHSKYDTLSEPEITVQYTRPKSIFKMKYPAVIRF